MRVRSSRPAQREGIGMRNINLLIGGKPVKTTSGREGDVFNPNTGEVQARVGFSSTADAMLPGVRILILMM